MEAAEPLAVLLVEDHVAVARLMQELLRDQSTLRLTWVETLGAALARLHEAPFDVVLLDLGLPDSQGLASVVRVVQDHPTVPVIVLTAHDDGALALGALQAGAQDYISKGTMDPDGLVRAIRYAVERKRGEVALREAHEFTNQIVQSVQDGIVVYDREMRHRVWNPVMEALSGVPAAQVLGRHVGETPPLLGEASAALQRAIEGEVVTIPEVSFRTPIDGRQIWIAATLGPLRDARGAIIGVIGSVRDISVRKEAEEVLRSQSMVDDLTGLHNRRGFLTLAPQCLRMVARDGTSAVLLFADLDGLKVINDTWGHGAGDNAIRDIAAVLTRTFRAADVISRLGGDEFAVLAVTAHRESGEQILARLQEALEDHNSHATPRLALSVGVARYDAEQPCPLEDLLARADAAMYAQKAEKKARLAAGPPHL